MKPSTAKIALAFLAFAVLPVSAVVASSIDQAASTTPELIDPLTQRSVAQIR